MSHVTEAQARAAGDSVYRSSNGLQAWCLCPACTAQHASKNKFHTAHDRWAIDGQDWRILEDVARRAN